MEELDLAEEIFQKAEEKEEIGLEVLEEETLSWAWALSWKKMGRFLCTVSCPRDF